MTDKKITVEVEEWLWDIMKERTRDHRCPYCHKTVRGVYHNDHWLECEKFSQKIEHNILQGIIEKYGIENVQYRLKDNRVTVHGEKFWLSIDGGRFVITSNGSSISYPLSDPKFFDLDLHKEIARTYFKSKVERQATGVASNVAWDGNIDGDEVTVTIKGKVKGYNFEDSSTREVNNCRLNGR